MNRLILFSKAKINFRGSFMICKCILFLKFLISISDHSLLIYKKRMCTVECVCRILLQIRIYNIYLF